MHSKITNEKESSSHIFNDTSFFFKKKHNHEKQTFLLKDIDKTNLTINFCAL